MKKNILITVSGFIFLLTLSLYAGDDDDVKTFLSAVGLDDVTSSTIETDYNSFQEDLDDVASLVNEDNLEDIFSVADIGNFIVKDKDSLAAGIANLEYIKNLTNMNAIVRELEKNLKSVKKKLDSYTTDDDTQKALEAVVKYYEDLKLYLIAKTAENYAGISKDQKAENEKKSLDSKELYKKLKTDKTAIEAAVKDIPADKRETALEKIKDLYEDLEVEKPSYEDDDVVPPVTCNKKKDDCDKKAKQFMSSLIGKGKQPHYYDVQTQLKNDCAIDTISKGVSAIFKAGEVFCANQVRRRGMVHSDGTANKKSLACLSAFKVFGKNNSAQINKYIARLDSASTMNLAMLTSGAGNTSLGVAAFYPDNVFSPVATVTTGTGNNTNDNTSTTTTTTTSNIGGVADTGDGVSRYNSAQVTNFYNGAGSTYKNMGSDANSLISTYKPVYNKISSFNSDLSTAIVSSNPSVANIPETEKQWAVSTINKTAKVSTMTQQQRTDYLRLEFSKQQATVNSIITQMDTAKKNMNTANFMALYGSESDARQAAYDSADYELMLKMLAIQGRAASARLGLLQGSLGLGGRARYDWYTMSTHYMYAANDNKVMPRALKLDNIKTPINLKQGWEKDFTAYIDQMTVKSAEAKKDMEQAKEKIRKFISQKLPIVPFDKLPQPGEIKDELINMRSLRDASNKNLEIINKAMAYHDSRKGAYTADQYSMFKKEHDSVTSAMKRSVSSIERAEAPVNEARTLIKNLYKEVPRAEALKVIAKRMAEEGR